MNELPALPRKWLALGAGAIASATLLALLARLSGGTFVLAFFALVPWLLALGTVGSALEALGAGALMSVAFVMLVFRWLPLAVQQYGGTASRWPWIVLAAAAPLLEPQFLSFAVVRQVMGRGPGTRPAVAAALSASAAYVATELLANKLLFDTMGQGLYPSRILRQGADLAGVHGLTLLLLLVNEAIALAVRRCGHLPFVKEKRARFVLLPLGWALSLIGAAFAYGWARTSQWQAREASSGVEIGVVQANITNYEKIRAERGTLGAVRAILDAHYELSDELLASAKPDVIVWPETVYPTTFGSPKSEDGASLDAEILRFAHERGVPLIFGGYDADGDREYNAAFFLEGDRISTYRKAMLFPFMERVPEALDSAWLRARLPWAGHWDAGPGPEVVPITLRDGRHLSALPLICYDTMSPVFVARAAQRGADLIVTLSNDSWFPDARAPALHAAAAAFRSIETRLPQVRATNSGISGFITPAGDLISASRWGERRALAARMPLVDRALPPAVLLAPWLGPALACVVLAALLKLTLRAVISAGEPQHTQAKVRNKQTDTRPRRSRGRGVRAGR